MKRTCILLDLDGTLVDSYRALTSALNRTGAHLLERALSEEEVKSLVGEGVERLLAKAFPGARNDADLMARFESEYDLVCCEQSRLLDDVEPTIFSLRDAGIRMGVCTNKPTFFSQQIIDHFGLTDCFAAVVGPDVAGARKPDPAHLFATLERIGGAREDALFVGDMPIDIEAARAAEIPIAVIATGSSTAEELAERRPDYLLQRFSDVLALVERSA
jgi:phosphoglycolate phosphatase